MFALASVYYTSADSRGVVGHYNLDTLSATVFIDGPTQSTSFGGIWDIELDQSTDTLYFNDEDDSKQYQINIDGTGYTQLFEPSGDHNPHGLELYNGNAYNAYANSGTINSVWYAGNAFDDFDQIVSGLTRASGLAIDLDAPAQYAVPEPGVAGMLFIVLSLLGVRRT